MEAILLKNGRLIDPTQSIDQQGDLLIEKGVVSALGQDLESSRGCRVIDVSGKWVTPGFIDMHVHLREPGEEYKETVESGTRAAAAGGFTAVACMPNTKPVNDNVTTTNFILRRAAESGFTRVYPVSSITKGQRGEELTEFGDQLSAGAVAFSDDGLPVRDPALMRMALEYAKNFDALIISHSEDMSLSEGGALNEGIMSTKLGLRGIPAAAEEVAVYRDVRLAELTGSRLHVAHVSTRESVEIIRRAKARGVNVTAETAPHYFSLTEEAVGDYNTFAKMNPPLRTEDDRRAVIEGLMDGTIDVIATDHAPHSMLEKECAFEVAANGIVGLETALGLVMSLVEQNLITPIQMVKYLSCNPAKILGVDGGTLRPGTVADITVIDPESTYTVSAENFYSKSHNSPFLGFELRGRAVLTILDGKVVHDPDGLLR